VIRKLSDTEKVCNAKKYVGFKPPLKLVEVFDEVTKGRYGTRTAALEEAMRVLIRQEEEEKRQREA
jgi:metal-responsive CopG/Arc/MetJ family transcriptional regulator